MPPHCKVSEHPAAMLRVMSFNIRYRLAPDGPNCWEARKPLVIERVRAFDPHLLALQECRDDEQAAYVRESLPEWDFYGVPRGGGDQTALEMAPVLFKRSEFERVDAGCSGSAAHQPCRAAKAGAPPLPAPSPGCACCTCPRGVN